MTSTSPEQTNPTRATVAVLIPCYNEALTVVGVVKAFRDALPRATLARKKDVQRVGPTLGELSKLL